MKSSLKLAVLAIAATMSIPAAQAQTATYNNFNVNVNLSAACIIATTPADHNHAYVAFQGGNSVQTSDFRVRCSQGLSYTVGVALTSADAIAGTLGLTSVVDFSTGNGPFVGAPAAPGQLNTIRSTIASGQGGTCASVAPGCNATNTYTVTVSF